jgi:hypothetical protein
LSICSFSCNLTCTNVKDGFTIKYPHDWTVNDTILGSPILQHAVKFTAPNNSGIVLISTRNQTNQLGKSVEEGGRLFTTSLPYLKNFRLLELNTNSYFLSNHPAIRVTGIMSVGGSPHDMRTLILQTYVGWKVYQIAYSSVPDSYYTNLQAVNDMIGSFQIIQLGG